MDDEFEDQPVPMELVEEVEKEVDDDNSETKESSGMCKENDGYYYYYFWCGTYWVDSKMFDIFKITGLFVIY